MTDVVLDENFGIVFEDNDMKLFQEDDPRLVAQRLEIKLSSYKGEWFLDRNYGIPWIQEILSRRGTKDLADANIRRVILSDPDVKSITNYRSSVRNSKLEVVFDGTLVNGSSFTSLTLQV